MVVFAAKILELVGESRVSWEDAAKHAVREASKAVKHITGVEVTHWTALVNGGEIVTYKANVKVAFTDA